MREREKEKGEGVMGLGVTPLAGLREPPDTQSVGNLGRKEVEVREKLVA